MLRGAILPLVLAGAAALPAVASASHPCVAEGEEVVARGAEVVVTSKPRPPRRTRPAYGTIVTACERRTHRRTRLDSPLSADEPDHFVDGFRIAGRYVAFDRGVRRACSTCPSGHQVVLVDARRGRQRDIGPTGCSGGGRGISDLVVDRGGRLGWICLGSDDGFPAEGELIEVHKHDRDGPALLEASTTADRRVEQGSLRLVDRVLTWRTAGEPRSAVLR